MFAAGANRPLLPTGIRKISSLSSTTFSSSCLIMLSPSGATCAFSGTRLCGRSFTSWAGAGGCGATSAFCKFAPTFIKGCWCLGNNRCCGGAFSGGGGGLGNNRGCGGACGGGGGGGGGGGLGINAFPRPCPTF